MRFMPNMPPHSKGIRASMQLVRKKHYSMPERLPLSEIPAPRRRLRVTLKAELRLAPAGRNKKNIIIVLILIS